MKNKKYKILINFVFTRISDFGKYICVTLHRLICCLADGGLWLLKLLWRAMDYLRGSLLSFFKRLGALLLRPLAKAVIYLRKISNELRTEKKTKGKASFKSIMLFTGRLLFGKSGIFVILFNFAVPVISVFFLFSVITYAASLNYAVKLTVNDQFLGYIEDEQVFLDAKEVLQNRLNYLGNEVTIETEPSYSIEIIGTTKTLTKYEVADLILQNSDVTLDYGYGFYINDRFFGALYDFTNVKNTLESLLENYQTNSPDEEVAFVDDISCDEAGLYLSDSFIDEDWLIDLLSGTKQEASYYTVEDGDSHSLIADKTDLTTEELENLNPGFSESDLHTGDLIKCSEEVPYLSISVTRTEVYTTSVAYETETYNDDTIYEGSSRVMRDGESGENEVTADVTYVNGVETGREITKVSVITSPVSKIIAIGVKPTPAGTYKDGTAAYGKLLWPVNGGYVSEWGYWDGGYYGHKGVDIAGLSSGDPVYAGASGVVTFAGKSGDLGNVVYIYHEELGITSYYAHNSAIYVSVGQYVSQGECIAGAGETGLATGIHVHVGVQVGGTSVNPREYMDIPSWALR